MTDRDHFAAAALTGLLCNGDYSMESIPLHAFSMADAMLRERDRMNHDAAPAARAEASVKEPMVHATGEPGGEPEGKIGTGNTPAKRCATQPRNGAASEPAAWANFHPDEDMVHFDREYVEQCSDEGEVVPLYRHPPCQDFSQKNLTLTDVEREAVAWCRDNITAMAHHASAFAYMHAATLRNLLERLP